MCEGDTEDTTEAVVANEKLREKPWALGLGFWLGMLRIIMVGLVVVELALELHWEAEGDSVREGGP